MPRAGANILHYREQMKHSS